MGKKIVITEGQLKRLVQYQTKTKLNEGITFGDEDKMRDELNLDVEDGKFVDEKPYNPIDDAHSEHETAMDRMYNSDEWVKAQQDAMEDGDVYEQGNMFLGIGDEGFYDENDKKYSGDFDFEYDEEEYDDYDTFMSKHGSNQKWFPPDENMERGFLGGRNLFNSYKDKHKKPFILRKRRMNDDSISLNEGQLKLKESFKKFVTPSIINRQSSDIVRKRKK
jgi:hypothetical protein